MTIPFKTERLEASNQNWLHLLLAFWFGFVGCFFLLSQTCDFDKDLSDLKNNICEERLKEEMEQCKRQKDRLEQERDKVGSPNAI